MQQLFDEQRIKLAGTQVPLGLGDEVSAALTRAIAAAFVDSSRTVKFIAVQLNSSFEPSKSELAHLERMSLT